MPDRGAQASHLGGPQSVGGDVDGAAAVDQPRLEIKRQPQHPDVTGAAAASFVFEIGVVDVSGGDAEDPLAGIDEERRRVSHQAGADGTRQPEQRLRVAGGEPQDLAAERALRQRQGFLSCELLDHRDGPSGYH